jgi:hypothetical protein
MFPSGINQSRLEYELRYEALFSIDMAVIRWPVLITYHVSANVARVNSRTPSRVMASTGR